MLVWLWRKRARVTPQEFKDDRNNITMPCSTERLCLLSSESYWDLMLQKPKDSKKKFKILASRPVSEQFVTHRKTKQKLVKKIVEEVKEKTW